MKCEAVVDHADIKQLLYPTGVFFFQYIFFCLFFFSPVSLLLLLIISEISEVCNLHVWCGQITYYELIQVQINEKGKRMFYMLLRG